MTYNVLNIFGSQIKVPASVVGWRKRTPKSDKIERRRCWIEKGSTREIHEGIEGRSGKDGTGGEVVGAGGSPEAVIATIDTDELDKGIQGRQARRHRENISSTDRNRVRVSEDEERAGRGQDRA
jgi:hypothetical protein